MALVRRSSSVKSRSSASSASHPPPLPGSSSTQGVKEEEADDLSTVGRKKSVSKSRRKDSNVAQRPHDLSHGHLAHHSTHLSPQFSPYSHGHAHPPNHAPLSHSYDHESASANYSFPPPPPHSSYHESISLPTPIVAPVPIASPRPMTNEQLAASFFCRDFDKLETPNSTSPSTSNRTESRLSSSAASQGSGGGEFKRTDPVKESIAPPTKSFEIKRPIKERKRSGLAQMYGCEEEEEEEVKSAEVPYPNVHLSTFTDYALPSSSHEALPVDPSPTSHCDYSLPRPYNPPIAEYSSTAPSAYSDYSGYAPPLARTQSYSVEEEEDPLSGFADLQPQQQTDLDILEWIQTISQLPPSSTPAATSDGSVPLTAVSSYDTVATPTSHALSYPESTPSVSAAPSEHNFDFASLVLSPTDLVPSRSFSIPSDSSPLPPPSSAEVLSSSSASQDAYFPRSQHGEAPDCYTFNSSEIHLERYGIDESYFARLGSFEPTATPTSTPVSGAFAGWEKRIEQTKGLMLQEFGERMQEQQRQNEVLPDWENQNGSSSSGQEWTQPSSDGGSRERAQSYVTGVEGDDWWTKLN